MAARVTSRDHGYEGLLKRVFGWGRPQVAMGILEVDGAKIHPSADKSADNPVTILQVGEWAEFGTETEPERSFIRKWFDEASPKMRREFLALLQGVIKGTKTKEQVLELIGQRGQGDIQKRIADGIDPPNAASTIRMKGSSKQLIGLSGALRASVSYAVRERGGGGT